MTTYQFPDNFLWGTATSSYQIEGAVNEGGKGESIWDRFAHTPGKIIDGSTGDVTCDYYHRWAEDIALMKSLGVQSYRFSVAWPRILPTGGSAVNQEGLDFYSRVVDGLLAAGITPYVTLYHWDMPQAIQDRGGWPVRATVDEAPDAAAWDGSVGVTTDLLEHPSKGAPANVALICGPELMMRFSVRALLLRGMLPADIFVSLERHMKCGIGHCGHCQIGPHYVCQDGPVFSYAQLRRFPDHLL